jgi:hypothetical protein
VLIFPHLVHNVSKLVETERSLQIEIAHNEKRHAFGQPKVAPLNDLRKERVRRGPFKS